MRLFRLDCLILAVFLFAGVVFGRPVPQQKGAATPVESSSKESAGFEPLEKWRAAVLAGDKAALTEMYATVPPATAKTPEGDSSDPAEEPNFWSALHSSGLATFEPKILEMDSPRPGVEQLTLHINLTLNSKSGDKDFVVSAAQVWLHQGNYWRIIATQRGNLAPKVARRLPEPRSTNPHLYPEPREAPADLRKALAAATEDHKRVLVVFGGNWCYDCHVLDAAFHSKKISPLVEANYHVVHVNIGEYDRNLELAKRFEVPLEKGVPALAVLGADGKLLTSQKQGEFESSVKIGPGDVVTFLEKWKPPADK